MISMLSGILVESSPSMALVDVAGVGYELGISATTAAALPTLHESCRLFCRMVVREDAINLYGFYSKDERTMFDRLISVSKVGPRLALAILSKYSVPQLFQIILSQDDASMSAVSGIGKKTAQRLILELKGVLAQDNLSQASAPVSGQESVSFALNSDARSDARAALLSMGFLLQEADLALEGVSEQQRVEEMLTTALKRLGMDA
ncbi:Holliday junction branch migration protein RuvA [Collinsella sp. zg1085]|uniref:Holliday junction branch migration protein RuvA n=1 Tax=Collinsella sp. zg1085 TaxID=2844380 RepID=UPI001C0DD32F|nr:Holliday junction branch migration protein RuvA [Collinsella sp. zg1085]QWT17261.1 Holliday junction branch migration protein RuvA [Collinsella sp. zg1085]